MNLGLKGKVIVVTGGASGIGQAVTRLCLEEGARVAIVSKRTPVVDEFLAEAAANHFACSFFQADLEDSTCCEPVIRQIGEQFGAIDALVNNVGLNDGVSLQDGTVEDFVQSLHRSLVHYFALAHYALPALKRSRGSIVNVASKVALTGQGGTSGYAASKGAILALTREWAVELLPFGIRVNAVIPSEVMTPAYETWLQSSLNPEERLHHIERNIPLGHRMTTPEEIAAAIVFLLSPTQSSHTTGQQLVVDGGYIHLDRAIREQDAR